MARVFLSKSSVDSCLHCIFLNTKDYFILETGDVVHLKALP